MLKTLYTDPVFLGTKKAAVVQGVGTFHDLQLKGIPGERYAGQVSSALVDRIIGDFEISLKLCEPGEKIVDSAPSCVLCPAGTYSSDSNRISKIVFAVRFAALLL